MKSQTLSQKIFQVAKEKGLKPHSITNNCILIYNNGEIILGDSKKDLLNKVKNITQ